jgi:retron-type reverse transcriptase
LRPVYPHNPIQSLESLGLAIGVSTDILREASIHADGLYVTFPSPTPRKDGTVRMVNDVREPLKTIQKGIHKKICLAVSYPPYLHGSLRKRSRLTNAREHLRSRILIGLDIEKFFDNVREELIHDVWSRFFRFPPEVAELLTKLTSHNGFLPQGAPTSSDLANLVFWERESQLVNRIRASGLRYGRLVDDISISGSEHLSQSRINAVIGQVRHFATTYGLHIKNKKTDVAFRGSRQLVNNLLVNDRVAMPREKRRAIRAAVHHALRNREAGPLSGSCIQIDSPKRIAGRLSNLAQFHPREAEKYREQLRAKG